MNRTLEPELLDDLPASDPRAVASRRDLRLLNAIMGNHRPIIRFLRELPANPTVAEIGAGEGLLSLRLAKALSSKGRLLLIDQQPVVSDRTLHGIAAAGWTPEVIRSDIFDWLESTPQVHAICTTLFLHHFEGEPLRRLLELAAAKAKFFAASETLRERQGAWVAKRLWLIGCNEVTCHDGAISVRAGFRSDELSQIWPRDNGWQLTEKRYGIFTHFFAAQRR